MARANVDNVDKASAALASLRKMVALHGRAARATLPPHGTDALPPDYGYAPRGVPDASGMVVVHGHNSDVDARWSGHLDDAEAGVAAIHASLTAGLAMAGRLRTAGVDIRRFGVTECSLPLLDACGRLTLRAVDGYKVYTWVPEAEVSLRRRRAGL